MKPYYANQERAAQWRAEARSWLGVPFRDNTMVKDVGVDCSRLQYACHLAAGACHKMDLPHVRLDVHWHCEKSVVMRFLKSLDLADGLKLRKIRKNMKSMVGDIAVIEWGKCPHHIAGFFEEDVLIHTAINRAVAYQTVHDKKLRSRLVSRYRIMQVK